MPLTISTPGRTVTPNTSTNTSTTQDQSANLGLVRSVVGDVLSNQAKGIEYDAAAAGQRISAAGYDAEIASYASSGKIAQMYAAYSAAAGDIQSIQAKREALSAAGGQRASLASSGFADSADIVRSTLQRGYLQDQIVRTQSNYEQSGYLEQAAASATQSTAAGVAKSAALNLGSIYDNAALQSRTYAANETTGLSDYLGKFNLPNTTAEGLLSGTNVGTEIATAPKVTTSSTTGSSEQGSPTFIAKAGTHAGDGYYVGLEDSPFGVMNAGTGTLAGPDKLNGLGQTASTTPSGGSLVSTKSVIGKLKI